MTRHLVRLGTVMIIAAGASGCDSIFGADDERAPTVVLAATAPAPLESDSLRVTGTVRDDRGVRRVAYSLDGGEEVEVATAEGQEVAVDFVARGLSVGAHTVEVRAYDAAGNVGRARLEFRVADTAAPVVALRALADSLLWRDSVFVEGVARDGHAVTRLFYQLDAGPDVLVPVTPAKEVSFRLDLNSVALGPHRLVVVAEDAGGNQAVDTVRFVRAGAELRLASPASDTTLARFVASFRGEVKHSVPIARIAAAVDGGAERTLCTADGAQGSCGYGRGDALSLSLEVDSLPQGPSAISLRLYHASGRLLDSVTRTVRVQVPVRRYSVSYLGTLGGDDSRGAELNESGQVVGWSSTAQGTRNVFVWTGSRMIDLGLRYPMQSTYRFAASLAINENGEVVGTHETDCLRSFYWRIGQGGAPEPLGEGCDWAAGDINDASRIALSNPRTRTAYLLDRSTEGRTMVDVGTGSAAWFLFLNNRDEIAGVRDAVIPWTRFYTDRAPTSVARRSPIRDLNEQGDLLLSVRLSEFPSEGLIRGESQTTEIFAPGYRGAAELGGLNNRRQAAGVFVWVQRRTAAGMVVRYRPFIWEAGTSYSIELSDPAWEIDAVSDLNDAGVILAHGRNTATGQQGAVLLRPIP